MKPIISGTTTERMLRSGLVALLISVFAGWYLYDGFVGYPRANLAALLSLLGREGAAPPPIDPAVTAEAARQEVAVLERGGDPEEVYRRRGPPSLQHEMHVYYVGPGGYLRFEIERGRIVRPEWVPGAHSETDLRWQKVIGFGLAAVALILVARFLIVVTTRAALSEAGLKAPGRPLIPWEAMRAVSADEFGRTATAEITYADGERTATARLDGYVIARLPEIIAEICEEKGLPNPLAPGPAAAAEAPSVDPRHGT